MISKKTIAAVTFFTLTSLLPAIAAAGTITLENPLGNVTIYGLVANIIKGILAISGAAALLMVIYGGFLWLTSAGNTKRIESGKDTLKWAVLGLLVIATSYSLLSFVIGTLQGAL